MFWLWHGRGDPPLPIIVKEKFHNTRKNSLSWFENAPKREATLFLIGYLIS